MLRLSLLALCTLAYAYVPSVRFSSRLHMSQGGAAAEDAPRAQLWASAVSIKSQLKDAVNDVARRCLDELEGEQPDLALVHCSSMHNDARSSLVPLLRAAIPGLKTIVGCTCSGVVGFQSKRPLEVENKMALGLCLASLPGVSWKTFQLEDVPEDTGETAEWSDALPEGEKPIFLLYSSTQFVASLGDFLEGMDRAFPESLKFGGIASTVSSLSRPQLFVTLDDDPDAAGANPVVYSSGVVGIALWGDIRAHSYISQGARPVGPAFVVDRCEGGTVFTLRPLGSSSGLGGMPALGAVKQLREQLPAEDAARLTSSLLVGVKRSGGGGSALAGGKKEAAGTSKADSSDAAGEGYYVQPVGRIAARDGSITLSFDVEPGSRVRFFIRDQEAATTDLDRCLQDYKRKELEALASRGSGSGSGSADAPFQASGALLFPSFDRGRLLYGEVGYESTRLAKAVPVPSAGFFSNGVMGSLAPGEKSAVFGTSSAVLILSPKTRRKKRAYVADLTPAGGPGGEPDSADGPGGSDDTAGFEIRRRDVGSGRAMSSGTVEYSVAEKLAQPRNRLEAIVWQKEVEVDRLRDRVPLRNLAGQLSKYNALNKPRSLVEAMRGDEQKQQMTLMGELKRMAPLAGVLRRDFDASALAKSLVAGGARAVAVYADPTFFGVSMDDLTAVKGQIEVPVLCSDVIVYPYQVVQARLAGADAVKLIAAALPDKDLTYFHKAARAAGMQVVVAVSSVQHMLTALAIPGIQIVSITNRNLANWSLDMGRTSRIMADAKVRERLAALQDVLVLAEGGIKSAADVAAAKEAGVAGVIVGESLLRREDLAAAVRELMA